MPSNAYEDIVAKTTDENLTSENWELILNLCDKVNDEGESGARAVTAVLLKRLAHRSPTVQLYSLSLAEALSKNCGETLHRELASRSFTQGLEKLITDRNTHDKVKKRGLYLISLWTGEFETNPQLGLMEELYESLKAKDYNFEQIKEPQPPALDEDEMRRKEEEELQKVLEMSLRDKGGRNAPTWETSGGSSSSSSRIGPLVSNAKPVLETSRPSAHQKQESKHVPQPSVAQATSPVRGTASSNSSIKSTSSINNVTRVRALHSFEPTVAGELGFEKGDIIKVTDRAYENWWRGQLKGRTGIFPVNYVEPLPDLTVDELAREAEQEATVFSQAANIDKLVEMLRAFDPSKDNLADNEEIQELYRSSMALRPKIVKLIDKFSQKRAELVAMNENFVKARAVFDQIMEESLARHTGVYETRQQTYHPETRGYNWDTSYEQQQGGYGGYGSTPAPYQASHPPFQSQPYPTSGEPAFSYNNRRATVYGGPQMSQGPPSQAYPPGDQYATTTQSYGPPPETIAPGYPALNVQSPSPSMAPFPQPQPQPQSQSQPQSQTPVVSQTQPQPQPQPQPQLQTQGQYQNQVQAQPSSQAQLQGPSPQNKIQPQQSPQQQLPPGPPYPFDPNIQYPDPNVQAWAQYYAQGGTDTAGSVYFISLPGITDASAIPSSQSSQPRQRSASTGHAIAATATSTNPSNGGLEAQGQMQMGNQNIYSNNITGRHPVEHAELGPKRQSSQPTPSSVIPPYEAPAIAGHDTSGYPNPGNDNITSIAAGSDPSLSRSYAYGLPAPVYTSGAPLQHASSN